MISRVNKFAVLSSITNLDIANYKQTQPIRRYQQSHSTKSLNNIRQESKSLPANTLPVKASNQPPP